MKVILRSAACLPLVLCLANCTIGFDRKWKKATAETRANPPVTLSGAWEGTWKSAGTGHEGKLRAIATPLPSLRPPPAAYDFHYEATWMKILSACMTARHHVVGGTPSKGGPMKLTGEKDLGVLGGVYRFTGSATPTEFRANYESKDDHGVFEMKRPKTK